MVFLQEGSVQGIKLCGDVKQSSVIWSGHVCEGKVGNDEVRRLWRTLIYSSFYPSEKPWAGGGGGWEVSAVKCVGLGVEERGL